MTILKDRIYALEDKRVARVRTYEIYLYPAWSDASLRVYLEEQSCSDPASVSPPRHPQTRTGESCISPLNSRKARATVR